MMTRLFPVLLTACLALGCSKDSLTEYTMSHAKIMAHHESLRGEIFRTSGATSGLFKVVSSFVGNYNTKSSFRAGTIEIHAPAVPKVFHEGTTYINSEGEYFLVVSRVSQSEIKSGNKVKTTTEKDGVSP